MKIITLLLVLLSGHAVATGSAEFEVRINTMNYKWGDMADYPLMTYQAGFTKYFGSYGLRILGGQSNTRSNLVQNSTTSREKMRNFWVLNLHKKHALSSRVSVQIGVNYTEYKSCSDVWGCNPDTGYGYGVAIQYKASPALYVKLSLDDYYTKYSKSVGKEITQGLGLSLVFKL